MQSFLQYRRLERRLRQQIDRHGVERTAGCDNPETTTRKNEEAGQHPNPFPQSKEHEVGPPTDLEKGDDLETSSKDDEPKEQDCGPTSRVSSPSSTGNQRPQITLSRATTRDTHDTSLGVVGTRLGRALSGINVRSRTTNEGGHEKGKVFIVGYADDNDPLNPHNWSKSLRMGITIIVASIGLIVGFASSVDSAVLDQASKEFHVGNIAEALATGLYLVGFGVGAFFAAPISETVGRNPVYIATMSLFMIFVIGSGLAPNLGAQLAFRFLAGFFGSTPLTCAGGSISDMWTAEDRTVVFPIFANAAFWGPILGPVLGGFIGEASKKGIISWRWTEWVTLIWSGLVLSTMLVFMPETYTPTLMKWKAGHLRKITGDKRYMSQLEVQDTRFIDRMIHNLYRPFILFVFEPIVVLFTLYLTVVYIVLFTFLTGFAYIFEDIFGISQGLTFLSFIGLGIGFFGASALVPWVFSRYRKKLAEVRERGGTRLNPEQRLIFAMTAAPCLPVGLFWMAWTAYPKIGPWSCIVSTVMIGFSIMGIFISTYQYLIDSFEAHAASALVGATFVRYVVAGGMVEVSIPMYENLGVHWTLTVLGAIGLVMAPVPFVFYKFGAKIRTYSRHAIGFGQQ